MQWGILELNVEVVGELKSSLVSEMKSVIVKALGDIVTLGGWAPSDEGSKCLQATRLFYHQEGGVCSEEEV